MKRVREWIGCERRWWWLLVLIPVSLALIGGAPGPSTAAPGSGGAPVSDGSEAARGGAAGDEARGAAGASDASDEAPRLLLLSYRVQNDGGAPRQVGVELVFSQDVDADLVMADATTVPYATVRVRQGGVRRIVVLEGSFAPQTRYELTVPGDLCAVDGGCLDAATKIAFRTGGGTPLVRMPTRETVLPPGQPASILFQDVDQAKLSLVEVRPGEVPAVMGLVGVHPPDQDAAVLLPPALRKRLVTRTVDVAKEAPDGSLLLDPFAGRGNLVLVVAQAAGAPTPVALFQRGEIATVLKLGQESGLVWAASTSTGQPIANAEVTVFAGGTTTFKGVTNQSGLLRLPAQSRLRPASARNEGQLLALVRAGKESSVTAESWNTGLEQWEFDLPYYYYSGAEGLRGMVTAERGIYRPGERVHLLGVVRRKQGDGRLTPPGGAVELSVTDPDGTEVHQSKPALTPYGTLRSELELAKQAPVGTYSVRLTKDGATLYHSFEVGAFRAASFEVKMALDARDQKRARQISIPVEARYLYGAPVRGGKVKWTVSWRPRSAYFEAYPGFSFVGGETWGYARHLTDGSGTLDAEGKTTIELPASSLPTGTDQGTQSLELLAEVTVTDAADQAISARTAEQITATETLVGVSSDRWIVSPKDGWNVSVIVLDPTGKPIPGKTVHLELERTYWNSVAQEGPYGVRYESSRETEVVHRRVLTSTREPQRVHLELPGGGEYRVTVREAGSTYSASRETWAYGTESAGAVENHPRIELVKDKKSYEPGETARVFAALPYAASTVLVTLEREGILEARIEQLTGSDRPVEVSLTERHLPNAYLGVVALPRRAADAAPSRPSGGTPLRVGLTELEVSPARRRLALTITPEKGDLEPGKTADLQVQVRDHRGQPVSAEVTLWAADEGVLMLTGYETPDPFAPAYARHGLGVELASNLTRWTPADPGLWTDETGGDSGLGGSALRSRFLATAFFSKGVVTDASGNARVRFAVPDNLTRWRVMAIAADAGQRFGRAETSLRVSKPFQVTPALPRFLTAGDLVDAGVVVSNETGSAADARVGLEVRGGELLGSPTRQLRMEPGAQVAVRFPVRVNEPGAVTFTARGETSTRQDAFTLTLPAHDAAAGRSLVLGEGRVTREPTAHQVGIPAEARPGSAELRITLAPSLLASLESGVEALLDYPHGCAEQKTSRLIPMVLLGDLVKSLKLGGIDQASHRERLQDAIGELRKHQNDDGGFGLWEDSETEPFISAYVLWGLLIAKDHGYAVPDAVLHRGLNYVGEHVRRGEFQRGYFSEESRPFFALVLARAGRDDAGLAKKLLAEASQLSRFDRGLLAATLTARRAPGGGMLLDQLLKEQKVLAPGLAVVEEATGRETYYFNYGSDVRATGAAVLALSAGGRLREVEALARGILSRRGRDGTWGTTYNNLWALHALVAYVELGVAQRSPSRVTVKLDGKEIRTLDLAASATAHQVVLSADVLPQPGRSAALTLVSPGGLGPYYSLRLRYTELPERQRALSHGYQLEREVVDAETGIPETKPRVGQLLRVRLRIQPSSERQQVALTDRVPAGFEILDARLQTEQQREEAAQQWYWTNQAIHDDRISFFANELGREEHTAEYLVRVLTSGEMTWPSAFVESMYDPTQMARNAIEKVVVDRR